MSEWISVKDKLPEIREAYTGGPRESTTVLCFSGFVCTGRYGETYRTRRTRWDTQFGVREVTHWQPLPDPPKEGE